MSLTESFSTPLNTSGCARQKEASTTFQAQRCRCDSIEAARELLRYVQELLPAFNYELWIAGGCAAAILSGNGKYGDVDLYIFDVESYIDPEDFYDVEEAFRLLGWETDSENHDSPYSLFTIWRHKDLPNCQLIYWDAGNSVQIGDILNRYDLEVCQAAISETKIIEPPSYTVKLTKARPNYPFKTIWRAAKYAVRGYETDHEEMAGFVAYCLGKRFKRSVDLNESDVLYKLDVRTDHFAYAAIALMAQERLTLADTMFIMNVYSRDIVGIVKEWIERGRKT